MVLKVHNLTTQLKIEGKIYKVIDSLSFELERGKTLALVGESGCGKSMTALSLLRILPTPPAVESLGEILYQKKNLLTLSETEMRQIRGKGISMIFQDPFCSFNPVYTIGKQLKEMASTHLHVEEKEQERIVLNALADVCLPDPKLMLRAYPHQLSGGMLQRAMIAMALLCSPDVLIADEPTTALDVSTQTQILELLRSLQKERNMAILLITHNLGLVIGMADRVLVMYAGQKVEEGSVQSLLKSPAHPYTQALLASRPSKETRKTTLATIAGYVPRLTHMPQGCRFHPRCSSALAECALKPPPYVALESNRFAKCWLHKTQLDNLSFGLSSSNSGEFTPQILGFSGEVNGQRSFASTESTRDASKVPEFEEDNPKLRLIKDDTFT